MSKQVLVERNIYKTNPNTYMVKMRTGFGGFYQKTFFDAHSDSSALEKARDYRDLKRISKSRDSDHVRVESSTHSQKSQNELTFGSLLTKYKNEITPTKKDVRTESLRIDMLLRSDIAKIPANRLNGQILREHLSSMTWRNQGKRPITDSTKVRYQALVSHVYKIARTLWRHILENPVEDMQKFTNNDGRERRLIAGEKEFIYKVLGAGTSRRANKELQPIFLLALGTGCRESETLTHDWADLDWEHNSIYISSESAKSGRERSVPIFKQDAIDSLISLWNSKGKPKHGQIFYTSQGALIQAWEKAIMKARKLYEQDCKLNSQKLSQKFLVDLNFHDLRHEAASFLFESTDLKDLEIMQILGHQDLQTTKRYAHLRSKHLGKRILDLTSK